MQLSKLGLVGKITRLLIRSSELKSLPATFATEDSIGTRIVGDISRIFMGKRTMMLWKVEKQPMSITLKAGMFINHNLTSHKPNTNSNSNTIQALTPIQANLFIQITIFLK